MNCMSKLTNILFAFSVSCGFAAALTSCVKGEDDVFEASAANRLNNSVNDYTRILESQEKGWVADFYPADRSMGGYAYTALFKDGNVTMTCEMDIPATSNHARVPAGTEVTSCYQVISEQSVLLTFDTYNALLHYWSQPSGTDLDGFASDYEFVFISACADSVVLRGKKYGNLLKMYPMGELSQTEYALRTAATKKYLTNVPRKRAMVDGKPMQLTMAENHLTYPVGDTEKRMPYIHTPNGIRFYEPVTLADVSVKQLNLVEETGELVTPDGRVQMPMPTLSERFCGTMTQWHFIYSTSRRDRKEMCDELYNILMPSIITCMQEAWETVADFYIGMNKLPADDDPHRAVIGWSTTLMTFGYEITYGVELTVADDERRLVNIRPTEGGNLFYNYSFFQPLVEFIGNNSPYLLTFNNEDNPTRVTLNSEANPNLWFTLRLR